jgi:hypothetical protein
MTDHPERTGVHERTGVLHERTGVLHERTGVLHERTGVLHERTGVQSWRGQERGPAAVNVLHAEVGKEEEAEEDEKEKKEEDHRVVTGSLRSVSKIISANN